MEIEEEIIKMAEAVLTDSSHFIVTVSISSRKGPKKVLVVVDGDNGVGIDDCATISRALSSALEETDLIKDQYLLEVSTPGLDQPLKMTRQYIKNIGRKLKVNHTGGIAEGTLVSVEPDKITLHEEKGAGKKKEVITHEIAFSEVSKSFVLVSFK